MNLKDMITGGTIVKFRDGRLAVAMHGINPKDDPNIYKFYGLKELISISSVSRGGIIRLDAYDDCLNSKEGGGLSSSYDIMAIAHDHFSFKDIMRIMFGFMSEDDIFWDWERKEIKELTMAEVEEKFGCKVKIVKEEN